MYAILILVLANICISAYAFHKIRKIHLSTYRIENNTFRIDREVHRLYPQIQAYLDLAELLKPRRPLPLLRGWAASPDFLMHAASIALTERPRIIVECSSGASTIVLARCCEINGSGKVLSLEHDPVYAEKTRQQIRTQGLERWAFVVDAPLVSSPDPLAPSWYSTANLHLEDERIDFLVIDGPIGSSGVLARYPAMPVLWSRLGSNCFVILDDADRPEEAATIEKWVTEFPLTKQSLAAEKGCILLRRQVSSDNGN